MKREQLGALGFGEDLLGSDSDSFDGAHQEGEPADQVEDAQDEAGDLDWVHRVPKGRQEMNMVGAGNNKSNISAVDPDSGEMSLDDIGEGLGVGENPDEESKQANYIEALQFTGSKPKHSKGKATSADQASE